MATDQLLYLNTTAPTVNDDSDDGYKVLDIWGDTTNDLIYIAIDVSVGAAVWVEITGRTLTQTLTDKNINLASNTLTGTTAQFNTALSDNDFATLAGSETLTNKTLTAPTIADFTNAAHDHGDADDGGAVVSSSATVAGVVELATDAEAITGTDTARAVTPANLRATLATMPDGTMLNLKLNVTVSSDDLVVALKTHAGTDPSATDPGYVKINGTVRSVTASTSFTLADGTSWFAMGGVAFGGKENDYFAYLVWDSNSSIVAISASRIPLGKTVNATDFSTTTTNERHLVNYSNFTVGDDMVNIGRFAATLSLSGTSHLWTVPTFSTENLIQSPIGYTRVVSTAPTFTNITIGDGTQTHFYTINGKLVTMFGKVTLGSTSSIGGAVTITIPLNRNASYGNSAPIAPCRFIDASPEVVYAGLVQITAGNVASLVSQSVSTYVIQTVLSSTVPITWTTSDIITYQISYLID